MLAFYFIDLTGIYKSAFADTILKIICGEFQS